MKKRLVAAATIVAGLGIAAAYRLKPQPSAEGRPEAAADEVAAGLVAFAADLTAGDAFALEAIGPRGEMPCAPQEWADYPDDWYRQARLAYLGDNRGAELPDDVYEALDAADWTPGQPLPANLRPAA